MIHYNNPKDPPPMPRKGTNPYRVLERLKHYGSTTGFEFVFEEKILSFSTAIHRLRHRYGIPVKCVRIKNSAGKKYGIYSLENDN